MTTPAYEGWAMLELMGHRQRVGRVSEAEVYGGKMLRIDIPIGDLNADVVTEFYGCSSIYAMRPISEDVAREYAKRNGDPRPVRPVDFRLADQRPSGDEGEEAEEDELGDRF